jgi:hypothetical protein
LIICWNPDLRIGCPSLEESQWAMDLWGAHVGRLLEEVSQDRPMNLKIVA